MEVSRIHLCRHGEVDPSWHGRIYGGHDVPLSEVGKERLEALADDLASIPLAAVYASDLARATDGASRIARRHDLTVKIDERFREIDRGAWMGRTTEEIEAEAPGSLAGYLGDPDRYRAHGGESHHQLRDRAFPALEEVADRHRGEEVLVLCHGQVMRVLVSAVLGIPGPLSLNMMTTHGGVTTLDRYADGVWVVQAVNAPTLRRGKWGGRTFKP